MAYFQPKTKTKVLTNRQEQQQQQPFYLSWFQMQGQDLKRGGTAPQETRKVPDMKTLQQSPQNIFKPKDMFQVNNQPSPYGVQQKPIKSTIEKISKIYTNQPMQPNIMQKRKSTDNNNINKLQGQFPFNQFIRPEQQLQSPSRTQTFQQSRTQNNFNSGDQYRPQSQQYNAKQRKNRNQNIQKEDNYDNQQHNLQYDRNDDSYNDFNDEIENQNKCIQSKLSLNNLYKKDRQNQRIQIIQQNDRIYNNNNNNNNNNQNNNNNNDYSSNESQEANSKRNSLSPKQGVNVEIFNKNDENTFTNRSAFQQRDNVEAKVNFTQHKNTVNMHRPMTSEGGRRKRAAGNLQTNGDRQQQDFNNNNSDNLIDVQSLTIQQYDSLAIIDEQNNIKDDVDNYMIQTENQIGYDTIQDFDQIDFFKNLNNNNSNAIRSGFRKKNTDGDQPQLEENVNSNGEILRPPSRSKIPPQAVGLEVPINNHELNDIPIKNMYANMDDDELIFEENVKMENISSFLNTNYDIKNKKQQLEVDDDMKRLNMGSNYDRQSSAIHFNSQNNQNKYHPQSANNTKYRVYKGAQPQYSNNDAQSNDQFQSGQAVTLNSNNFEIVIKHNISANFQKSINTKPIKLPFQTSLGQDFLRLFANQHIKN